MPAGYVTAQTQYKFRAATGVSTFVNIDNVLEAPGGGADKAAIDVTAIDDTADAEIGGTVKFAEITITIALDPSNAGHQSLISVAGTSGSSSDLEIAYPQVNANCKAVYTAGYFKGGGVPAAPVRDALKMTFTFVPAGAPVWTYA